MALTGRAAVRDTLYNWLANGNINGLNQVHTSIPKRIDFKVGSIAGQLSRTAAVIFIQNEAESRIALGGAHNGWKRIDYTIIVQVFHHSMERDSQVAMDSFDLVIDAIKTRLRSDHNFGDTTGTLIWQGAEPSISVAYGEPITTDGGATETWAGIQFEVTQMIQA